MEHTRSLNTDYVLGLLPLEERRRVERHARQCDECRTALQREQAVGALVRGAVQQAARPAPGRLEALRPPLPAPGRRYSARFYQRLAPVTLVAVMLVMGLMFASGRMTLTPALYGMDGTPTQTATSTHTPTATLAEIDPVSAGAPATLVAPATSAAPVAQGPAAAPLVAPTPIIQTAAP